MTTIHIDAEFKALIPPLTDDEYQQLESNMLTEGCRDALVVWSQDYTLIDGHNRYAICQAHGIPFTVIEKDFDNRDDVIVWMVRNQLARRNIVPFVRVLLADRMSAAIAAKAKANQLASLKRGDESPVLLNSTKREAVNTRAEIAKAAETSEDTVRKVKKVKDNAPRSVAASAQSGELSVDRAYKITMALQKLPEDAREAAVQLCGDNDEKINILARLHQNAGSPDTNGTYQEIMDTGGFQFGKEMERWLNYSQATVEEIRRAIESIKLWHIEQEKARKRQAKEDATRLAIAELKDPSNFGVVVGDMRRLFDDLEDESVDLFFTDPPYHEEHIHLYNELARLAAAKLKPGGLCLTYAGQTHLPRVMKAMSEHLAYWWMFAISHTGGNLAIWQRKLQNEWKPVLVYAKPYRNGSLPEAPEYTVDFVPGGGRDKRYHEWGQDAGEITYWIEKLTAPRALICDPFVGGGSIPVACKLVGRQWIGTEIDEPMALQARLRIAQVTIVEGESDDKAA